MSMTDDVVFAYALSRRSLSVRMADLLPSFVSAAFPCLGCDLVEQLFIEIVSISRFSDTRLLKDLVPFSASRTSILRPRRLWAIDKSRCAYADSCLFQLSQYFARLLVLSSLVRANIDSLKYSSRIILTIQHYTTLLLPSPQSI